MIEIQVYPTYCVILLYKKTVLKLCHRLTTYFNGDAVAGQAIQDRRNCILANHSVLRRLTFLKHSFERHYCRPSCRINSSSCIAAVRT